MDVIRYQCLKWFHCSPKSLQGCRVHLQESWAALYVDPVEVLEAIPELGHALLLNFESTAERFCEVLLAVLVKYYSYTLQPRSFRVHVLLTRLPISFEQSNLMHVHQVTPQACTWQEQVFTSSKSLDSNLVCPDPLLRQSKGECSFRVTGVALGWPYRG